MIVVRPTYAHAQELAANMREEDKQEVASLSGAPPDAARLLKHIMCSTVAYTLLDTDGRVILIGGVAPVVNRKVGAPWMLATPLLTKNGKWIARHTRPHVEALHRHYPVLTNWADTRNIVHINWLRWAGFRFLREVRAPDGAPFVEFFKVNSNV